MFEKLNEYERKLLYLYDRAELKPEDFLPAKDALQAVVGDDLFDRGACDIGIARFWYINPKEVRQ